LDRNASLSDRFIGHALSNSFYAVTWAFSMACLETLPATFSTKQLKMICNDVKYALVSILTGGAVR
jgi:hypothetical protein